MPFSGSRAGLALLERAQRPVRPRRTTEYDAVSGTPGGTRAGPPSPPELSHVADARSGGPSKTAARFASVAGHQVLREVVDPAESPLSSSDPGVPETLAATRHEAKPALHGVQTLSPRPVPVSLVLVIWRLPVASGTDLEGHGPIAVDAPARNVNPVGNDGENRAGSRPDRRCSSPGPASRVGPRGPTSRSTRSRCPCWRT